MEDNHSKNSVPGDSTDLTTVKGEKTGIPKWLMVTVIAMAALIVGLTVTLIAVIAGKSSGETSHGSQSLQSSHIRIKLFTRLPAVTMRIFRI